MKWTNLKNPHPHPILNKRPQLEKNSTLTNKNTPPLRPPTLTPTQNFSTLDTKKTPPSAPHPVPNNAGPGPQYQSQWTRKIQELDPVPIAKTPTRKNSTLGANHTPPTPSSAHTPLPNKR